MQTALIITSISKPNKALIKWAEESSKNGYHFILVGDINSPEDLKTIKFCDYYSIERQKYTGLKTAEVCPYRHYARKNIGYLIAMRLGVERIVESDDDNHPHLNFWVRRPQKQAVKVIERSNWVNIYKYFTNSLIWPRGLPLTNINSQIPTFDSLPTKLINCPIQQGLANGDPDVDAIYRLIYKLPFNFEPNESVALYNFSFCPFNSQNTNWWGTAFPLLYLPAYCSFRLSDIWRSIIAQRIAFANDWGILFHAPTVNQLRNKHDLMKDFSEEIPGYLYNEIIINELLKLDIKKGNEYLGDNLCICYEKLIESNLLDKKELIVLSAWLNDLESIYK